MPSPPCDRSSDPSTCENMSKTRGNWSAGMPMPVSLTDTTHVAPLPLDGQPDVAAPVGVLGGVVQQVREHLRQPGQVGVHDDRAAAAA